MTTPFCSKTARQIYGLRLRSFEHIRDALELRDRFGISVHIYQMSSTEAYMQLDNIQDTETARLPKCFDISDTPRKYISKQDTHHAIFTDYDSTARYIKKMYTYETPENVNFSSVNFSVPLNTKSANSIDYQDYINNPQLTPLQKYDVFLRSLLHSTDIEVEQDGSVMTGYVFFKATEISPRWYEDHDVTVSRDIPQPDGSIMRELLFPMKTKKRNARTRNNNNSPRPTTRRKN
jgi:hypothetical protein